MLKCWVEIWPTTIPVCDIPTFNIAPKPPEEFEVRVVIFDTVDVICMDAEGTSDVFARCFFDTSEQVRETDTHFRCSDGKASFNYRLLFNTSYPRKDHTFTIQLYDRDFFKSNDLIGDYQMNLKLPFEDASLAKRPMNISKSYYNEYLKKHGWKDLEFKDDLCFMVPVSARDEKTG